MLGGVSNPKRRADGGWDGYLTFYKSAKTKGTMLVEVKSGGVTVKDVRMFAQVVNKKKSELGVFVCFEEQVTKPMLHEAKSEGYYETDHFRSKIDKLQIITVEDLLDGKGINFPVQLYKPETFKAATKKLDSELDQFKLKIK